MHETTAQWHLTHPTERAVQLSVKLKAETWPLFLIPRKSLRDIRRGFGSELQTVLHDRLRSFARTCSHVSPGPGAGSSKRRSSSSLCQSGMGTFSGVAARLSQISSTSLRRSLGGSCRISSRNALLLEAMIQSCEVHVLRATCARGGLTDS